MNGIVKPTGLAEPVHQNPVCFAVRVAALLFDLHEDVEGQVGSAEAAERANDEVEGLEADLGLASVGAFDEQLVSGDEIIVGDEDPEHGLKGTRPAGEGREREQAEEGKGVGYREGVEGT